MARQLKPRGFCFVGPTTAYSLIEAAGLVNDHLDGCEFRALAWERLAVVEYRIPRGSDNVRLRAEIGDRECSAFRLQIGSFLGSHA
jgi:Methyladenine glycosylase